jgi:hypothetical protein
MNLPPKTALAAVLLSTALCPRATHALDNQPLSAECHIAVIEINGQVSVFFSRYRMENAGSLKP